MTSKITRQSLESDLDEALAGYFTWAGEAITEINQTANYKRLKVALLSAVDRYVQSEVRKVVLEKDIKYHTLQAKYQRMFLGGEEDALPTKRYVKKLKALRQQVKGGE